MIKYKDSKTTESQLPYVARATGSDRPGFNCLSSFNKTACRITDRCFQYSRQVHGGKFHDAALQVITARTLPLNDLTRWQCQFCFMEERCHILLHVKNLD